MTLTEFEFFSKFTIKELKKIFDGNIIGRKFYPGGIFYYDNEYIRFIERDKNKGYIYGIGIKDGRVFSISPKRNYAKLNQTFEAFYADYLKCSKLNKLPSISSNAFISYISKAFKQVFSETDIIHNESDSELTLLAHIPSTIITNTTGIEHELKDIYLKFIFEINSKRLIVSSIARTTVTLDEYNSEYVFSHSNAKDPGKWSSGLCFGNNTPLDIINRKIRNGDYLQVYEFFTLSEEYLKWESIEGIPYKYISKIGNNERGTDNIAYIGYLSTNMLVEYERALYSILPDLKYDLNIIGNGNLSATFTLDSLDKIDEVLTTVNEDYNYLRCNGESIKDRDGNNNLSNIESRIVFNGNTVPVKILNQTESNISDKKLVHISIRNKLVSQVENELSKFITTTKIKEVCQ